MMNHEDTLRRFWKHRIEQAVERRRKMVLMAEEGSHLNYTPDPSKPLTDIEGRLIWCEGPPDEATEV